MPRPFITMSRSVPWSLVLATALLFACVQDLRHEHADGLDAPACYTCHFSVELGALPGAGAPAERRSNATRLFVRDTAVPRAALRSAYDARGPPLLS